MRLVDALFTDAVAVFTALNDDEEDHVRAIFFPPLAHAAAAAATLDSPLHCLYTRSQTLSSSHPRGTVLTPSGSIRRLS